MNPTTSPSCQGVLKSVSDTAIEQGANLGTIVATSATMSAIGSWAALSPDTATTLMLASATATLAFGSYRTYKQVKPVVEAAGEQVRTPDSVLRSTLQDPRPALRKLVDGVRHAARQLPDILASSMHPEKRRAIVRHLGPPVLATLACAGVAWYASLSAEGVVDYNKILASASDQPLAYQVQIAGISLITGSALGQIAAKARPLTSIAAGALDSIMAAYGHIKVALDTHKARNQGGPSL